MRMPYVNLMADVGIMIYGVGSMIISVGIYKKIIKYIGRK